MTIQSFRNIVQKSFRRHKLLVVKNKRQFYSRIQSSRNNLTKRKDILFIRLQKKYFGNVKNQHQYHYRHGNSTASPTGPSSSIPTGVQVSKFNSFFNMSRRYFNLFFVRYPMFGGGLIGGLKAAGADYFTQMVVEKKTMNPNEKDRKKKFNRNRTILFGLLGVTYGGFINYFLHSYLNPMLWGTGKTPMVILKSILFDQLVHVPFFSFPLFYGFKGMVYSNGDPKQAKRYISHYWNVSIQDDLIMCWKLWVPCHMITYGLVPRMMRVYWVNLVSATWTGILSYKRGELAGTEPPNQKPQQYYERPEDDDDATVNRLKRMGKKVGTIGPGKVGPLNNKNNNNDNNKKK